MRANKQLVVFAAVDHPRQLERFSHSGGRIVQGGDGSGNLQHRDPMEAFHSWDFLKAVVSELDDAPGNVKVCGTVAPHFRDSVVLVNFLLIVHEFPLPHKVDAEKTTSVRFPTLNSLPKIHACDCFHPRVATSPQIAFFSFKLKRLASLNSRFREAETVT